MGLLQILIIRAALPNVARIGETTFMAKKFLKSQKSYFSIFFADGNPEKTCQTTHFTSV